LPRFHRHVRNICRINFGTRVDRFEDGETSLVAVDWLDLLPLAIAPIAASAITYLVVILGKRGIVFRSMLGQRRYIMSVDIDRHG
jgi:hypothetical protein